MKFSTLVVFGVLVVAVAPATSAQVAAAPGPTTPADSGFRAFLVEFVAATTDFLNGDARAWMAMVSPASDVTLFNPLGMSGKGPRQVGAMYAKGASRLVPRGATLAVEYLDTVVRGDLAYTVAIERSTFPQVGQEAATTGFTRATDIFRQEDGHWKLIHRHIDHLEPPS